MNKRAVIQVLVVLLLILLLAFWGLGDGRDKIPTVRKISPKAGSVATKNLKVPLDELVLEEPEEPSKSPPEQDKPVAEAVSHSGWVNNGAYEVFGEVVNVGDIVARQVKARVIFKTEKWVRLDEIETPVDIPTLAPGQKSPFKVRLKIDDPKRVGSYVLLFTVTR